MQYYYADDAGGGNRTHSISVMNIISGYRSCSCVGAARLYICISLFILVDVYAAYKASDGSVRLGNDPSAIAEQRAAGLEARERNITELKDLQDTHRFQQKVRSALRSYLITVFKPPAIPRPPVDDELPCIPADTRFDFLTVGNGQTLSNVTVRSCKHDIITLRFSGGNGVVASTVSYGTGKMLGNVMVTPELAEEVAKEGEGKGWFETTILMQSLPQDIREKYGISENGIQMARAHDAGERKYSFAMGQVESGVERMYGATRIVLVKVIQNIGLDLLCVLGNAKPIDKVFLDWRLEPKAIVLVVGAAPKYKDDDVFECVATIIGDYEYKTVSGNNVVVKKLLVVLQSSANSP